MSEPICDYAGYDYKKEFWDNHDRAYEDGCERQTLVRLIQASVASPNVYLDAGCGFGRLFDTYEPYANSFVLLDYAQHLLDQAQVQLAGRKPIRFVQGDLNALPLENASVDMVMSVRTLHHLAAPRQFFSEVSRVLTPGGVFIFEVPNQRHLLNMGRYYLGKLNQNPFSTTPLQLGPAYFNFHPKVVMAWLESEGFKIQKTVNTSFFRLPFLKRILPASVLVRLDMLFQRLLSWVYFTPSVYILAVKPKK